MKIEAKMKIVTKKQVMEQFCADDLTTLLQHVREAEDSTWTPNDACEMILDIMDSLKQRCKETGENIDAWSPMDRIAWIVKEAFIAGMLHGCEIWVKYNQMGVEDLFSKR